MISFEYPWRNGFSWQIFQLEDLIWCCFIESEFSQGINILNTEINKNIMNISFSNDSELVGANNSSYNYD